MLSVDDSKECQINACHSVRVIGFPSGDSRSFDHSMYLDVILINM